MDFTDLTPSTSTDAEPGAPAPSGPGAPVEAGTPGPGAQAGRLASAPTRHGMRVRRLVGTVVLTAGLLGIGGASVALAASPSPSQATTPSTQQPAGVPGYGGQRPSGAGAMPGGCMHHGTSDSSGTSGSGSTTTPSTGGASNG